MRTYSTITSRFWIGETGKKIKAAGKDARILATYLLTAPGANMIGLYYLPIPIAAHETGLTEQEVSDALNSLSADDLQFCRYDHLSEMVWVIEMAAYQVGDSLKAGDRRVRGVEKVLLGVPKNPFTVQFIAKYGERFGLSDMPHRRGFEGASKGLPSPTGGASKGLPCPIEGASGGCIDQKTTPAHPSKGLLSPYVPVLVPGPVPDPVPGSDPEGGCGGDEGDPPDKGATKPRDDYSGKFYEFTKYHPEYRLLLPLIESRGWKRWLSDLIAEFGAERVGEVYGAVLQKATWYRDHRSEAPAWDQLRKWYREKCERYEKPHERSGGIDWSKANERGAVLDAFPD